MKRLTRPPVRSLASRASTRPFLQSLAAVRARIRNVRTLSLSARFGGGTESAGHKPGLRKLALRTWALRAWRGRECRLQSLPLEGLAASVISHSEASHLPKDLQGVHLLLAPWLSGLVHSQQPALQRPCTPRGMQCTASHRVRLLGRQCKAPESAPPDSTTPAMRWLPLQCQCSPRTPSPPARSPPLRTPARLPSAPCRAPDSRRAQAPILHAFIGGPGIGHRATEKGVRQSIIIPAC
jgi:hypothetical protein